MPDSLPKEKLEYFKKELEEEKKELIEELQSVGRKNPSNPEDWEAKPDEMDTDRADLGEVSEKTEEYSTNASILNELEVSLNQVKRALNKIDLGTYGRCEVGGEAISEERLEANPSAVTCIEHADKLRP